MLDMYLYAAITKHDSRIAPGLLVSGVTTSHLETMTAVVGLKTLSARHTDRLLKSAYANSVNISEDLMKKYRLEGLCPHILNNFIQPVLFASYEDYRTRQTGATSWLRWYVPNKRTLVSKWSFQNLAD